MKLLGFAAFLVICTPILGGHLSGNARSDDPEMTGPWRNGRYWIQLSVMGKLSYLLGHSEGYLVAALLGYQEYRPVKSLPPALPRQTFGDIVELLDRFYSAPENRNIGLRQCAAASLADSHQIPQRQHVGFGGRPP